MEINGPYVVVSAEFWTILQSRVRKLNADLIPEMDKAATMIELDNHHNAILCPYCRPSKDFDPSKLMVDVPGLEGYTEFQSRKDL